MRGFIGFLLGAIGLMSPASSAFAAAPLAPQTKDYTWIINSLKSEGISPERIPWAQVDELCKFYLQSGDSYHTCRLEKARLQYDFTEDSSQCSDTAAAFRPNTLRYKAVVIDNAESDVASASLTMLNTPPAVADGDAFHRHLFNQCMRNLGWKNPHDYRRGRAG